MLNYTVIPIGDMTVCLASYDDFKYMNYIHYLTSDELKKFEGFTSASRKKEFIATRALKAFYFPELEISYSTTGAPKSNLHKYISISHCKGYSAIAVSNDFKIGLDLELLNDKAKKVIGRFLNDHEKSLANIEDEVEMTQLWSAKEALFKLIGTKGVIWKEQLLIDTIDRRQDLELTCRIKTTNTEKKVTLRSIIRDNLVITINTQKAVNLGNI